MSRVVIEAETRALSDAHAIQRSYDDPDWFAVLYDRHAAQVYRYVCRRIGAEAAEDVTAETFLIAFGKRRRYDLSHPDARPWVLGIATREVSRRRRAEQARLRAVRRLPVDRDPAGTAEQVTADISARATRGALAEALSRLAGRDRDVLLLVAWGQLSYEEVAQALGIPVGTVRSRLNRARRKMQDALGGVNPLLDNKE
jgi:RNA polymerase sigma factor (sigma-70 family)